MGCLNDLDATSRRIDTSAAVSAVWSLAIGRNQDDSGRYRNSKNTSAQKMLPTPPLSLLRCSLIALLISLVSTNCFTPNHGALIELGPVYINASFKNAPNAHPKNGAIIGTQK